MNRELLLQAIARGWCHPKNAAKVMDPDLAQAIADEVLAAVGWSLQTLRETNQVRQVEWSGGQPSKFSLSYHGNEMAGEVGEACNVIKKLEREALGLPGSRAAKEQLAEELADVVICADLVALTAGVDLYAAVPRKFNATSAKVVLKTRMPEPEWPTKHLATELT